MALLPSFLLRLIGPLFNVHLLNGSRIGFSYIDSDFVYLNEANIGHFNYIKISSLILAKGAYIVHCNRISGKIAIKLSKSSAIGNFNTIVKASSNVKSTSSSLYLGVLSKITSRHYIDCLCNITILSYSTLAGSGSQVWTHGYYHYPDFHKRVRIDGSIRIGRYCYIGSNSVFNPGVKICNSVNLGANSTISKNIDKSGFYVNQALRMIEGVPNFDERLSRVPDDISPETAYEKK